MCGPKRLTDSRANLPRSATNMLMQRPPGIEKAGVLRKVDLPQPAWGQARALLLWRQRAGTAPGCCR